MIAETEIRKVIEQVLMEMGRGEVTAGDTFSAADGCLPDITEVDLRTQILVPNPANREALAAMKKNTPARVGVWRAGPRYKTETLLRFRADHAAAMDAVFSEMPEDGLIRRMNLEVIQTLCTDKDHYLTRPDLGRKFSPEGREAVRAAAGNDTRVVIYISDGLSTTAVETCAEDAYKAIVQGLSRDGIRVSNPFFVKYGRVPAEDEIAEVTGAEVVCALIGERPGLVTAESMSAYMAYKPTVGMPEARRTVVSNIHRGGTPPVEAGSYIADIIKMMLDKKASGLDLKL